MVAATSMLQIGLALLVSGKRLGAWHRPTPKAQASGELLVFFLDSIRFDDSIDIRLLTQQLTHCCGTCSGTGEEEAKGRQASEHVAASSGRCAMISIRFSMSTRSSNRNVVLLCVQPHLVSPGTNDIKGLLCVLVFFWFRLVR